MSKLEVKDGITQAPRALSEGGPEAVHVHQHDEGLVPGPLPEYFSCLDNGGGSHTLRCKKCGKGYKVPSGSVHPGNKIALMNHVRTHSELEEL